MGGRGIHALNNNKQVTLIQVLQQNEVKNIRETFQQIRLSNVGRGSTPIVKQPLLKVCLLQTIHLASLLTVSHV